MYTSKINIISKKLVLALFAIGFAVLILQISPNKVDALTSAEVQKKAETACGKGDSAKQKACRNGFREGYAGVSKNEACGSGRKEPYKTKTEKTSCESGHKKGVSLKSSTDKSSGSSAAEDTKRDQCGKGESAVKTKFNLGCVGNDYEGDKLNPILDVIFALTKFLSAGVGIVLVGSIIWAGILYSSSQGNPEQTKAAKNRIQNAIIGLVLYMFIFAIVQYLVPGGLFT